MIMFWNKREVFVGASMRDFNRVMDDLASNGIYRTYRVVSNIEGRGRTGTFGTDPDLLKTYYVYVHKKDLENALHLIGR
ncbi:hypothetical protein [Youngiibacter multivorans]|nr:hypothetical protein [Youngiibacter multivorans]